MVEAIFHSSTVTVFGWLVPRINFQIHPKGKEKALSQKRKPPTGGLNIAYSDTVIPQIPVSSKSHWSSKIASVSKSIKPACVKTNTKYKTKWLSPSGVYTEGLQRCTASRKKERDLKKMYPTLKEEGGGLGSIIFLNF